MQTHMPEVDYRDSHKDPAKGEGYDVRAHHGRYRSLVWDWDLRPTASVRPCPSVYRSLRKVLSPPPRWYPRAFGSNVIPMSKPTR